MTDCNLGLWTEVGKGTVMKDVQMGDYSYITQHCHAVWTTIGKFCSIANSTRINPGNHPTWRATQHHSVYRAEAYGLRTNSHAPTHLFMDSTGLKIFGEGEWLEEKHKTKAKRKSWRKLHLGLDLVSGDIVCSDLTTEDVGDPTASQTY